MKQQQNPRRFQPRNRSTARDDRADTCVTDRSFEHRKQSCQHVVHQKWLQTQVLPSEKKRDGQILQKNSLARAETHPEGTPGTLPVQTGEWQTTERTEKLFLLPPRYVLRAPPSPEPQPQRFQTFMRGKWAELLGTQEREGRRQVLQTKALPNHGASHTRT